MNRAAINLLPGQEVFTVASVQAKLEAQLRCLGCGFLAEPLAREHIRAGRLVVKRVQREPARARLGYAWREAATPQPKLPPTTQWVTAKDRAEQRATRARQFKLRCLGTPCEVGGKLDTPY